jgi:hypothetical protein
MRINRVAGTALLVAALWPCTALIAPAADLGAPPLPASDKMRPSDCQDEAVLLVHRLELRPEPDLAAAATILLMPGDSIYRCERRGAFLGVMFPEEGGRVDCSLRTSGRECPTGWTDAPLEVEITD